MDTAGSGVDLGRFWAAVTGCSYAEPQSPDDPGDVVGPVEGMGIAICRVPEEKTVKNRVHLDVHTDSVDLADRPRCNDQRRATGRGTRGRCCSTPRVASSVRSCAMAAVDVPRPTSWSWTRPRREWRRRHAGGLEVFGVEPMNDGEATSGGSRTCPGMPFESLVFDPVPEPKTVKNRVHWDVYGDVGDFTA